MTPSRLTRLLIWLAAPLALLSSPSAGQAGPVPAKGQGEVDQKPKPEARPNPQVVIKTNHGEIRVELFAKAAPKTVKNFLDLAAGRKEFKDPRSGKQVKRPFYDGLVFHRVIKDFMIQGGCPLGTGTGDPGYKFPDEIGAKSLGLDKLKVMVKAGKPHAWLSIRTQRDFQQKVIRPILQAMGINGQAEIKERQKELQAKLASITLMDLYGYQGYEYDDSLKSVKPSKGMLAMANSGPNTNGSQFFINLRDTPWLTGRHTVFGKVVAGMDIVEKIGRVKVDARSSKPDKPVKIVSIRPVKG